MLKCILLRYPMKKYAFSFLALLFFLPFAIYILVFDASPAYAQLNGCAQIPVGNPAKNQPVPAGCGNESSIVQKVIALARTRINNKGITYVSGQPSRDWSTENPNSNDPTLFDCSGFV